MELFDIAGFVAQNHCQENKLRNMKKEVDGNHRIEEASHMRHQVREADIDESCACCGRTHRKLYLTKYGWVGKTCAEHIKLYEQDSNPKGSMWFGWEKQFNKVELMMKGKNANLVAV